MMYKRTRKSVIVGVSVFLVIVIMLLSPSFVSWQLKREAANRHESALRFRDDDFRVHAGGPKGGSLTDRTFHIAVLMSKNDAYVLNETTVTSVSTYHRRGDPDVLSRSTFVTNVAMKIRASKTGLNEFSATMLSFTGAEHTSATRSSGGGGVTGSKLTKMFETIDEATRGVEFSFAMDGDGRITSMRTSELREKIISALHTVGQLPFHLEYALSVAGGTRVFPASGASFSPLGRTRVFAPIVRIKTKLCRVSDVTAHEREIKSKLLMIDRGDCAFYTKALNAKRFDVAGLIIVDNKDLSKAEEEANYVNAYMHGGDLAEETEEIPFVTLLIKKKDGTTIEDMVGGGVSWAPGAMVDGEILGGVNAVVALHEMGGGKTPEELEEEEEEEEKGKTRTRTGDHLALKREDGLHDFLGVSFIVDEMLRTRFSIYPASEVSIGSLWSRAMVVTDPTDPSKRALVDEEFKLSFLRRVFEPINGFGGGPKGDYFGELLTSSREAPVRTAEERRAFWERHRGGGRSSGAPFPFPAPSSRQQKSGGGDEGGGGGRGRMLEEKEEEPKEPPTLKQTFTRPGLLGHDYRSDGKLTIHLNTGMIVQGSMRGTSTGLREVALQSQASGKVIKFLAFVSTDSVTKMACTVIPGGGEA